jgi:hypothetical protein
MTDRESFQIYRNQILTMKEELISSYFSQLQYSSAKEMLIPTGYEAKFWQWFQSKSRVFNSKKIKGNYLA